MIYAYGEVYLFIDGLMLQICKNENKVNITNLVKLVNNYNEIKDKKVIMDSSILFSIKKEISKLTYESFDLSSDSEIIDNFSNKEKEMNGVLVYKKILMYYLRIVIMKFF